MNVQSSEEQNREVEGTLYPGSNALTELFTQKILDKEGLKE